MIFFLNHVDVTRDTFSALGYPSNSILRVHRGRQHLHQRIIRRSQRKLPQNGDKIPESQQVPPADGSFT